MFNKLVLPLPYFSRAALPRSSGVREEKPMSVQPLDKKAGHSMRDGAVAGGERECSLRSRTNEPSRMSLGQKMNSSSWARRHSRAVMDSQRELARKREGPAGDRGGAEGEGGPRFDLLRLPAETPSPRRGSHIHVADFLHVRPRYRSE